MFIIENKNKTEKNRTRFFPLPNTTLQWFPCVEVMIWTTCRQGRFLYTSSHIHHPPRRSLDLVTKATGCLHELSWRSLQGNQVLRRHDLSLPPRQPENWGYEVVACVWHQGNQVTKSWLAFATNAARLMRLRSRDLSLPPRQPVYLYQVFTTKVMTSSSRQRGYVLEVMTLSPRQPVYLHEVKSSSRKQRRFHHDGHEFGCLWLCHQGNQVNSTKSCLSDQVKIQDDCYLVWEIN